MRSISKSDCALRLELERRLHHRVEEHFAIGEPKIHRKRHGAAGGAEDDPSHTAGPEARPTLRRCEWLENGPRQRAAVAQCAIPAAAEKALRRRLKNASDLVERPQAQLEIGVLLEILEEAGVEARLSRQVVGCEAKLLATLGDTPGEVSGLSFGGGIHVARVPFGSRSRIGTNVPRARELCR